MQAHDDSASGIRKRSQAPDYGLPELHVHDAKALKAEEEEDNLITYTLARVIPMKEQITIRACIVGVILGGVFCIMMSKLSLSPNGIVPSLTLPGGLFSYAALQGWVKINQRLGRNVPALTAQESTVAQTFVVTCANIVWCMGIGTYLLAMTPQAQLNVESDSVHDVNMEATTYIPTMGRLIPFLFCIAVIGVFLVSWVRKPMIINYGLPYPSGTAMGVMINSFFTAEGSANAQRQLSSIAFWSIFSFLFSIIKWFFSGTNCSFCSGEVYDLSSMMKNVEGLVCGGFSSFPTFGIRAANWTFYFDFTLYMVGSGMLVSQRINLSMMLGAILSWGLMWPMLMGKAGDWYPEGLPSKDFAGMFGYKVILTLASIMGEGLYQVVKIFALSLMQMHAVIKLRQAKKRGEEIDEDAAKPELSEVYEFKESRYERKLRTRNFEMDHIPGWWSAAGYLFFAVMGTIIIPYIYTEVSWYMVIVAYLLAPIFAIPNVYGTGLTDQDNSSMFGKLGIFIFAAWQGYTGGVTSGLVLCGVMLAATTQAANLMQDFRTCYMTLAAPTAMFLTQIMASFVGIILAPAAFQLFWATGEVGVHGTQYENPYMTIYRSMAIFAVKGFSILPKHCMQIAAGWFFGSMLLSVLQDVFRYSKQIPGLKKDLTRWANFVPSGMAMGIPFYIGANSAVDMVLGGTINLVWTIMSPASAALLIPAVASGLIVGEGIWGIPSAGLAMNNKQGPMCMAWQMENFTMPDMS